MNFKNKPQLGSCFSSPPPLLLMRAICGTLYSLPSGGGPSGREHDWFLQFVPPDISPPCGPRTIGSGGDCAGGRRGAADLCRSKCLTPCRDFTSAPSRVTWRCT